MTTRRCDVDPGIIIGPYLVHLAKGLASRWVIVPLALTADVYAIPLFSSSERDAQDLQHVLEKTQVIHLFLKWYKVALFLR